MIHLLIIVMRLILLLVVIVPPHYAFHQSLLFPHERIVRGQAIEHVVLILGLSLEINDIWV
jgi:hypothetical protein